MKNSESITPIFFQDTNEKLPRVDISLGDCLACSGCITTAETVLISQQNHAEVLKVLAENNALEKVIPLSIIINIHVSSEK